MAGTIWDEIMRATGGPTVNDGLLAYYRANGATGETLMDAEKQWLALQSGGLDKGLLAIGTSGTVGDRQLQYWSGIGTPTPPSQTLPNDILFALGEKGFWLYPEDMSTLFQDTAGTIPITSTGQPIGLIEDKSPNGWNFRQPTDLFRPTLQLNASGHKCLEFNGINQWMVSDVVDLASSQVTVFASVRKLTDGQTGTIIELSATSTTMNGSFTISAPSAAGQPNFFWRSRGTVAVTRTVAGYPAPASAVLTGIGDIITPVCNLRVAGVGAPAANTQGTGPFLPYPIYIGRRGGTGLSFQGQINELVVRGAVTPLATIEQMEAYMQARL